MTAEILWLSPTDFVSGDDSLWISYPSVTHPAVEIKTRSPGDLKWIYLGLRVPPDHDIEAIHVCYQLSNSRSFLSQVRLVEMQTPDQAVVRHDDGTDMLSTTPICYRSPVVLFRPGAAVLLALRLNFGDVADTIALGAIGVEVLSSCTLVPSYTRSTLPAPSAPGCLARVTDNVRGLWMDQGSQWISVSGEIVNVKEFGAKGDGTTDDQAAFQAAIDSFSSTNDAFAGTVIVPMGTYRLASPVRIKKSVWIRGSQGASHYLSTHIKPDAGITAFVLERYNTPAGTASAGAGDWAQISNLVVQPAAKVSQWAENTAYQVGDRRRTGTGIGEDWRRHYICTQAGTSAASGNGPRSLSNDETLNYDSQTGNFTVGQYVTGATSGASGIIIADSDSGATGQLRLTSISGTFQDNETITDPLGGSATADGALTVALTDEQDGTAGWSYIGSGAGIKIRANGVTLRDVTVLYCSGNGVHIEAQDPEVPRAVANANSWHLDNINIWHCDGHGLYVNGSDANGGSFIHGVMYVNGGALTDEDYTGSGFNIYDSSFLGNTYVSIQMGSGGRGSIYADSVGGGNTWIGCYQEGTGGGENVFTGSNVIVGGGLSASIMSANSYPVVLGPPLHSRGHSHKLAGYSGPPWRANVAVTLGNKRVNNGNLYEVTVAGTTGSTGPSGTGANIVDGTARWTFIHAATYDGSVGFGSVDPNFPYFGFMQSSDDMLVGLPTYWLYGSAGGVNNANLFIYGPSGTGMPETGPGLIHAVNKTQIAEWPAHVPAGRALFDMVYVGGCKVTYGTGVPTVGIWNKGDRIFYKGAAVVAGGSEGLVCTTEGTAGSYTGGRTAKTNGTTIVTVSGGVMSTLKDQQDFKVGDKLTINGVTSRVSTISDDGKTLEMGATIPGGSGLAITFSNPVFKTFGSIAP